MWDLTICGSRLIVWVIWSPLYIWGSHLTIRRFHFIVGPTCSSRPKVVRHAIRRLRICKLHGVMQWRNLAQLSNKKDSKLNGIYERYGHPMGFTYRGLSHPRQVGLACQTTCRPASGPNSLIYNPEHDTKLGVQDKMSEAPPISEGSDGD